MSDERRFRKVRRTRTRARIHSGRRVTPSHGVRVEQTTGNWVRFNPVPSLPFVLLATCGGHDTGNHLYRDRPRFRHAVMRERAAAGTTVTRVPETARAAFSEAVELTGATIGFSQMAHRRQSAAGSSRRSSLHPSSRRVGHGGSDKSSLVAAVVGEDSTPSPERLVQCAPGGASPAAARRAHRTSQIAFEYRRAVGGTSRCCAWSLSGVGKLIGGTAAASPGSPG